MLLYSHFISLASTGKVLMTRFACHILTDSVPHYCQTKQRILPSCLVSDQNQKNAIFILESKNSSYKYDATLSIGYQT